ncbi:MAG: hypothetical protein CMK36_04525 [Porticoccaceae bacterium]|nr:hypothetical protein [Porticoccaceae bacterium]
MNNRKPERSARSDVWLLLLLTMLNVLNVVDRMLLSSFANYIVPDLQLTNTEFGLLTGLIFLIFYSVMGLFMGMLADTMNRTRLIAAGVALWSILTAVSGMAKGFMSLAIPRMFIGIGEAVMTPSAMSIIADRFPEHRLGFVSGIYYMGAPIGGGLSLLLAGYLGPIIGWRACFYLLGGIGILLAAIMFLTKETPRRSFAKVDLSVDTLPLKSVVRTTFQMIVRSPALMLTIAGGTIFHILLGSTFFDQLWFVNERGYERDEIAKLTGWLVLAGGIIGSLLGGIGGDRLMTKTGLGRPTFLCIIMIIFSPFVFAFRLSEAGSIWIPIGMFFSVVQMGAIFGPIFATVQELAPAQVRATTVAFTIMSFNIVGLGIGITGTGIAVDWVISQGWEQPYSLVILSATLFSYLAVPCFYLSGLWFRRDKDRVNST